MPSKRATKTYAVTFLELAKAAHSNEQAWRTMQDYNKLKAAGGTEPRITYSKFSGYSVHDKY